MSKGRPNYTPVFDELIPQFGTMGALVYGVIWRYCQMRDKACHASYETLAAEIGIEKSTVRRHVLKLRNARYLAAIHDRDNAPNWLILGERQVGAEHASGVQRTRVKVGREHAPMGEQVGREHTEETIELKKPSKQELKTLNATHSRKQSRNQTPAERKKTTSRPFWNIEQKVLVDHFADQSHLAVPKLASKAEFAAATKSWKLPLQAILETAGTPDGACALITRTISEMRDDNLTISAPRSIRNVALSIDAKAKAPTNGDTARRRYREGQFADFWDE